MNDQQREEHYSGARDQAIRAALDRHWAASDANAPVSRAKNGLPSGESLAAVIFGSPNSS